MNQIVETIKVLSLPIITVLWYHYWVWRMSKDTGLSYWTCARSLWEYANGDKDAVKKLRWVKEILKEGDAKDAVDE